jgi:hypothetical protein
MSGRSEGFLAGVSAVVGRFRGVFLPFGLFAIVAVGIHSGTNHIDDATFAGLNFFDALLDGLLEAVITHVWTFFGVADATREAHIFRAVDFIDIEVKDVAARSIALAVEILADLILAVPVFLSRDSEVSIRGYFREALRDPTILRIAAPLSAAMASVAGIAIIAREIQVVTGAGLFAIDTSPKFAATVAGIAGLIALAVVTWRLGWVVTAAAARWAALRAAADTTNQVPAKRRRLRGWLTLAVASPICAWAFLDAVAVLGGLRALLPG